MTARTASETREARRSSEPYCFAARVGLSASLRDSSVRGVSRVLTVNSATSEESLKMSERRSTEEKRVEMRKKLTF